MDLLVERDDCCCWEGAWKVRKSIAEKWGAAWGGRTLRGPWDSTSAPHHINWKELYAIYMAVANWGPRLRKRAVVIKSDNTVAIAYANRGRGKSPFLTSLARDLKALGASF